MARIVVAVVSFVCHANRVQNSSLPSEGTSCEPIHMLLLSFVDASLRVTGAAMSTPRNKSKVRNHVVLAVSLSDPVMPGAANCFHAVS